MSAQGIDLDEIREQITATDQQLLSLLSKRRELTSQVADSKIASGKAVRDQQREEQLLVKLVKNGKELGLQANFVTKIFHLIIEDSVLNQQAKLQGLANPESESPLNRVAFLGSKGSYSYLATQKYFSRRPGDLMEIGCKSFAEIIQAVESSRADYAVLPIENTSSGSINDVYDVLQHTSLSIIGELTHPIRHAMLVANDTQVSQIKNLYAHPQVFAQCSHYLAELSDVKMNPVDSSSAAMLKVSELADPTAAALGSAEGGNLYGLTAIESNLANQKENHSRFIVVARKPVDVPDQLPAKTTLIMSTSQQPGSLVEALLVLRDHGINMTKLESRPITGNPWEEMFYLDIDANVASEKTQQAIQELVRLTRFIKVLGCYPSEEIAATELPTSAIVHKDEQLSLSKKSLVNQQKQLSLKVNNVAIGSSHFNTLISLDATQLQEPQSELSNLADMGCQLVYSKKASLKQAKQYKQILNQSNAALVLEANNVDTLADIAKSADLLLLESNNMENNELLEAIGRTHKPIILMRGLLSSLDQWLNAAETILAQGNQQVILCEQGVRTLDSSSRYTLDLSGIPVLKKRTHLPVIVAPEISSLDSDAIGNIALASRALGVNGVILPYAADTEAENALNLVQIQQLIAELIG